MFEEQGDEPVWLVHRLSCCVTLESQHSDLMYLSKFQQPKVRVSSVLVFVMAEVPLKCPPGVGNQENKHSDHVKQVA